MIETLLGTLFGGLFRLAPEALKWLDRKDERTHELAMFDKQLEADRLKGDQAIAQINAQEVRRDSPLVAALSEILGLTDEALDNLYKAAAGL